MENASKALIIAGGIFLAILIISLFVAVFNGISGFAKTREESKVSEQLATFNAKYESYNRKLMYGADVISVINMAEDNNAEYDNDDDYKITVVLITASERKENRY